MSDSGLRFDGITKRFGATLALDGVSHTFAPGRIHALIGKNGSGKSTFIKLLSGALRPDNGAIWLNGARLDFHSPLEAMRRGIATVYQELSLVGDLSVAENIYLGRLPTRCGGRIDWAAMRREAAEFLTSLGVNIALDKPVRKLSVGQCQLIEIVKAVARKPVVLLLDEPTSALAEAETEHLFDLLKRLRQRGITMIYISHRLAELERIADTVTVLRDGKLIGSMPIAEAKPAKVLDWMFGDIDNAGVRRTVERDETIALRVEHLAMAPKLQDVSFSLRRGEVLGIAGLLGSGRTELLRAIFGLLKPDAGVIEFAGQCFTHPDPVKMKKLGLAYTSEDRKVDGLVQMASIANNLCMAALSGISRHGVIDAKIEGHYVKRQILALNIQAPRPQQAVSSLSGGNQQKVVVGNWLNTGPKVMLFDEPSRGIDVAAKRQIFEIVWNEATQGVACIVVSTELDELLEVCDRILVLRHGRIADEVAPQTINTKQLYALCMETAHV